MNNNLVKLINKIINRKKMETMISKVKNRLIYNLMSSKERMKLVDR